MFVRVLYSYEYESGDRVGKGSPVVLEPSVFLRPTVPTGALLLANMESLSFLRFATLFNSELRLVSYATELY